MKGVLRKGEIQKSQVWGIDLLEEGSGGTRDRRADVEQRRLGTRPL